MYPALFPRPPEVQNDVLGYRIWFFDSRGTAVVQTTGARLTAEGARFLSSRVEGEVTRRWVSRGQQVRYVLDFSSFEDYDSGARSVMIEWGRATRPHSSGTFVKLSASVNPFLRVAASTAVTLVRLSGSKIALIQDLEPLIGELMASPAA